MPHDDFAVEPIKGLPEMPPEGEVILWQGRPNWWALSKESLNLYWVLGYFVLLAAWRFLSLSDLMPLGRAFAASVPFLFLGGFGGRSAYADRFYSSTSHGLHDHKPTGGDADRRGINRDAEFAIYANRQCHACAAPRWCWHHCFGINGRVKAVLSGVLAACARLVYRQTPTLFAVYFQSSGGGRYFGQSCKIARQLGAIAGSFAGLKRAAG